MSATRSRSERPGRSLPARIVLAARSLDSSRRLAASASLGLFLTMFLPWYQETAVVGAKQVAASVDAWGAFSFVEAAVLLVAVGVLVLLFERADGKAFHLPGGDGWIVMLAGAWTCVLIIWRIFDKSAAITSVTKASVGLTGIEWGIGFALAAAGLLTYAGARIRAAHRPEPPLPGEPEGGYSESLRRRRRRAPAGSSAETEQPPRPAQTARTDQTDQTARTARSDQTAQTAQTPQSARPGAAPPDTPEPGRDQAPPRSSWRPADRPEWTQAGFEQDRPVGWLTRPSQPREPGPQHPDEGEDDGPPPDQLTIPFDER